VGDLVKRGRCDRTLESPRQGGGDHLRQVKMLNKWGERSVGRRGVTSKKKVAPLMVKRGFTNGDSF